MPLEPGPPPDNEPSAFASLTDGRLLNNAAITKMPTNQREWSSFIQELHKLVKNRTGNFDVNSTADAKFTGFATDPANANIWWHRYGQLVHMEFGFAAGDSNLTTFTITGIPEVIRPRDDVLVLVGGMLDNGSDLTAPSSVNVGSDGVLEFHLTANAAATSWTGANDKGFNVSGPGASIIYSLRSPEKL